MPHQLVYTSAPRGLKAGRSGYCTVARSRDLSERLILPIEQYSNYTHLVLPGQEATVRNPTIHLYRKHAISGKEYRILSRIVDAGADHTGRSNFIAHHLIFEDDWRGLPSPAVILRYWSGWKDRWDEEPTYIDEISPDEFRTLGQADGIPAAANDAYLAKGWDTPFTTYLQDGDSQADFEWMGTRDAPDARKRIAKLDAGQEKQAKFLKSFSGMLSAPDADEKSLLDVFAFALGQRSHAAEQEALGQARESLDNELRAIEQLAQRIAATVVETQGKVEAYRQLYEARCETGDASRLYQNCLGDRITPAERSTESAKAKRQDTVGKAQAEHQDALRQLESSQFPATGINPGYQNDLRTLADSVAETNHKLTEGIQKFEDGLNEHNRVEELRLKKKREEHRKAEKIQLTHRGTPVGTEEEFAAAYRGASSAKSKRWVLPVVIISVLVLMIAVNALIVGSKEPDNPILYLGKETDNSSRHRSFHVNESDDDTFYSFNDTKDIVNDKDQGWDSLTLAKRGELIKKRYGKVKDALIIIEKTNDMYFITIAGPGEKQVKRSILNYTDAAADAVDKLEGLHDEKFFSKDDKAVMLKTYGDVKICYEEEKILQKQQQQNILFETLQGFRFVIDGTEEEKLKKWLDAYTKATNRVSRAKVEHGDYATLEEKEAVEVQLKKELEIWEESIKEGVRKHVGKLPEEYLDVKKIRGKNLEEIKGWEDAYKIWITIRWRAVANLKHLPGDLTIVDIYEDLDKKFKKWTEDTPRDYIVKITNEKNYAFDLKSKKQTYKNKNANWILAQLGPPTRPKFGYMHIKQTIWDYYYPKTKRTLILRFGPPPNFSVGAGFVVLTVELKRAN